MATHLRTLTSTRLFSQGPIPFIATPRIRIPVPKSNCFAYPMASITAPAGKIEWLVVVPDKPGTHSKRLEVRDQHLANVKQAAESGFVKLGGLLLNEKPESGDASTFSFYGSTIMAVASSKEEVLERLSQDIYVTSGVWDLDKAQIWPIKLAKI
ncbi:hypothetical protein GGS21DRAFT_488016 [Xylaria nigripes]|nr:hypothetical protein GGS21DRAFT_488016 [Xylaria nigripes]